MFRSIGVSNIVGVLMLLGLCVWNLGTPWLKDIVLAVSAALGSTGVMVFLHTRAVNSAERKRRVEKQRVIIDPVIWGCMSVVLLTLAFDFFNRAIYRDGIYLLTSEAHRAMGLTLLDSSSIFLAPIGE